MVNYVTAHQAAQEWGVSWRRMRQLLQQGRVQGAVKVGRQSCVPQPVVVLPPQEEILLTTVAAANLV